MQFATANKHPVTVLWRPLDFRLQTELEIFVAARQIHCILHDVTRQIEHCLSTATDAVMMSIQRMWAIKS